MSASKSSKITK